MVKAEALADHVEIGERGGFTGEYRRGGAGSLETNLQSVRR